MPISTKVSLMIGKTISQSNFSQQREVWSSNASFTFLEELHLICLKPKRRKTTLNYMSEESSSWMTVNNLFPNIWASLEVLLTRKIYLWTFRESISNTTKFWRLWKRI
jgi:hypothetical protein